MNKIEWIPIIAAFIAGAFGSIISVIILLIQLRVQTKRERIKLICELAVQEHRFSYEAVKSRGKAFMLFPLASYIHYYSRIIEAVYSRKLNEKMIMTIARQNENFNAVLEKVLGVEKKNR
jgi:hypothetical protein